MKLVVYGNLLIAASAALITWATYPLLGLPPTVNPLPVLVFFATLLIYNLDRLADASPEDTVDTTERHRWIDRHRRMLWTSTGAAAVGATIAAWYLTWRIWLGLVPLGLAALAYCLPVLWGSSGPYRLKDISGLKTGLITIVWAGATAGLPALQCLDAPWTPTTFATIAERGLFIFALTLPFDLRDLERDRAAGIWTIPLAIGTAWTRRLALLLIGVFSLLVVLARGPALETATVPLLLSAIVTAERLYRATPDRREMYFVGQLDGMIALQAIAVAAWHGYVS